MITFEPKPIPIFPNYRPMYRVGQILLILHFNSIASKASLLKLHLFSWALNQDKNLQVLQQFVISKFKTRLQYFGIEPSLNRALNYGIAEGLIHFDGSKYQISEKGLKFLKLILEDEELFQNEKAVLQTIGKKISESKVVELKKSWENNA